MLHDILEESWAYQEMVREASTRSLLQGIEQGIQQSMREALAQYVELHFPTLVPVLERETYSISEPETLQRLLFDLFAAQTVEDAQNLISHVHDETK